MKQEDNITFPAEIYYDYKQYLTNTNSQEQKRALPTDRLS